MLSIPTAPEQDAFTMLVTLPAIVASGEAPASKHMVLCHTWPWPMGTGCDKAKLGRWTWAQCRGKNNMVLRCVSVCCPVPNATGASSVWNQHKRYLLSQNDDRDPQVAFWEDMRKEAQEWLRNGDQLIISGDVNNKVHNPAVETFFSEFGMHNLIFEHHSPDGAPTTYFRNTKDCVMDGLWGATNISAVRCGHLEPKEMKGDHSAIWVDNSCTNALGHNPLTPATPRAQHLQLSQPATVKKHLHVYKANILKHDIPGRQFRLEASTQPGMPLTAAQAKEANAIDLLKTKAMLCAH